MDAADIVIEQVATLFCCPMDAHVADGGRVVLRALEGLGEASREVRAEGELRHALHAGERRDGHDAGDDGHLDASEFAALTEVIKIAIVEEKLSADIVGTLVDFGLEMIQFIETIGRAWVAFREAGDADAETTLIGMRAGVVEFANEANQVASLLKRVVGFDVIGKVPGRIAAQGEDVGNASLCVFLEDRLNVGGLMADAGEVRRGIESGGAFETNDEIVRQFARGAARAIGDRDEGRVQRFE